MRIPAHTHPRAPGHHAPPAVFSLLCNCRTYSKPCLGFTRCWFIFLHGARTVCAGCSLAERPAERRDPSQHVPRGSSSDRQRKDAQSRSDNHVGVRARMDRSARMDRACTSLTNEPTSVCHVGCHRGDGRGGATTSPQQLRPAPSRWQSTAAWHRSSQPHQAGGSRHVPAVAS